MTDTEPKTTKKFLRGLIETSGLQIALGMMADVCRDLEREAIARQDRRGAVEWKLAARDIDATAHMIDPTATPTPEETR